MVVCVYAAIATVGYRLLQRRSTLLREFAAVATLAIASTTTLALVPIGVPEGYGLAKWSLVLHSHASTGYYTVARRDIVDLRQFLADYPAWISKQDALHVGTHPPGLFVMEHGLRQAFGAHPGLAREVVGALPGSVAAGLRAIDSYDPLSLADRATLGATGALTLLLCSLTVVPLYLLARAGLPAPASWATASFWPLVPSALLFQPVADTAFPFLTAWALAASAHAPRFGRFRRWILGTIAGLILALGMQLTLAFLPIGLLVAFVVLGDTTTPLRRRLEVIGLVGLGFLAPSLAFWAGTGADPFVIWWWNQRNHARFYQEYHRTYRLWLLVNPLELAVGLGLPAFCWMLAGFTAVRLVPRVSWALLGYSSC